MGKVKKITKDEYFQVIGLLAAAHYHNSVIDDHRKMLMKLLGEEDEYEMGYCCDAVHGVYTADELLEQLVIDVAE